MNNRQEEILNQLDKPEVRIFDENSVEFLEKKKKALYKLMAISSGIDLVMSVPEAVTMLGSFGGSIIIEEIIEYFISESINKFNIDTDIRTSDRITGFIPIPGFTALTIRCFKELRKINKKLKKLEARK